MSLTAQKIYDRAVRYLERYSSSTENLRRVLQRGLKTRQIRFHDVPPEAPHWVNEAVDKCVRMNLVNDATYTEGRVNSLRRQGRSAHYILRHLTQKGVDKKVIVQFLSRDEDDELAAAKKFAAKKRLGGKTDPDGQRKDLMKMLRAGFAMNIAKRALKSDIEIEENFD